SIAELNSKLQKAQAEFPQPQLNMELEERTESRVSQALQTDFTESEKIQALEAEIERMHAEFAELNSCYVQSNLELEEQFEWQASPFKKLHVFLWCIDTCWKQDGRNLVSEGQRHNFYGFCKSIKNQDVTNKNNQLNIDIADLQTEKQRAKNEQGRTRIPCFPVDLNVDSISPRFFLQDNLGEKDRLMEQIERKSLEVSKERNKQDEAIKQKDERLEQLERQVDELKSSGGVRQRNSDSLQQQLEQSTQRLRTLNSEHDALQQKFDEQRVDYQRLKAEKENPTQQ
ncbi:hypothetical protein GGU10DRAFT_337988, partial [Lentinula aff. detonsa]